MKKCIKEESCNFLSCFSSVVLWNKLENMGDFPRICILRELAK